MITMSGGWSDKNAWKREEGWDDKNWCGGWKDKRDKKWGAHDWSSQVLGPRRACGRIR